jgi:hypothetical protein
MRKTFCDRCGGECINTTVILSVRQEHRTSDGAHVGEDEYKPLDLCNDCGALVKELVRLDKVDYIADDSMGMARAIPADRPL